LSAIARLQTIPSAAAPPAATVAFVRDEVSVKTMTIALGPAASEASIRHGGIEEAIVAVAHDPSPRNLIVDLSGTLEPLAALDRLAEVCRPNTRVIALGETNDIRFYQLLRTAGVAEYLVKPVTSEAVRAVLDAAPVNRPEETPVQPAVVSECEVIAVVGARGGVGATMVAVSLAWLSGENEQRRTVLVDLDLNCGSASLALDVEPGHGLAEALANPDRIDALLLSSATAKLGDHLHLLSSEHAMDASQTVEGDAIARLVDGLRQGFQRVILDVPRLDARMLGQAFELADIIVIVTDFSLAGVRDAGRLIVLAEKTGPKARRLIVGNRMGHAKKDELPRADIEKSLHAKFAVVLPEDGVAVPHALNSGKAVPAASPASKAALALRELSGVLGGKSVSVPQGMLARFLSGGLKKDRS
jgi:pilus assembly protein CpaE